MYLIKEDLFKKLYDKYKQGVPISKLIQQHDLGVTPPTLTKLIMYYDAWQEASNDEVGEIIYNSLFPKWINEADSDITLQNSDWRYEGKMPLGQWVKNDWSES